MDKQEILKEIESLKHYDSIDWNKLGGEEQNLKSKALVLWNKYSKDQTNENIRDEYRDARDAWMVKSNTLTQYIRLRHLRIELAKLEGFDILKLNPDLTIPGGPETKNQPGPDQKNDKGQLSLF
jgi:hypothetical protein